MTADTSADLATSNSRDEFQQVFDFASNRFGADSAAAALVGERLQEIEIALAKANAANTNRPPKDMVEDMAEDKPGTKPESAQSIMLSEGLMKSPVLMVGLGFTVIGALMGFSTLFIGMLAAKWLAL